MAARSDKRKMREEEAVDLKQQAFDRLADALADAMRHGVVNNSHVSYLGFEMFNAVHDRLEPF